MTNEYREAQLAEQRHHYLDLDDDSRFPVPGVKSTYCDGNSGNPQCPGCDYCLGSEGGPPVKGCEWVQGSDES